MTWLLEAKDLKRYPHFGPVLSAEAATGLATNPARVASHTFFPFILYEKRWTRFAPKGEKGEVKIRPIRYAARADAYIYSRYRALLSEAYEKRLVQSCLSDSIIAYRKIPVAGTNRGKCNIDFAKEAFDHVRDYGECFCISLDISSFFESLDHQILLNTWKSLTENERLSDDHYAVFKAITRYSIVDKSKLYERLGHFGPKSKTKSGKDIHGYTTPFKKMPTMLCSGIQFRQSIAGGNGQKSLVRVNKKPYGIPQGSPISDLLANMYLFDFDFEILEMMNSLGGIYLRYSDDILLIFPSANVDAHGIEQSVRNLISNYGARMKIKESKSSIHRYSSHGNFQKFDHLKGKQGRNGLEYLGFRYDGSKVFLRDSTIANLNRKTARSSRAAAVRYVDKYPDETVQESIANFPYDSFIKKFGRVENFGELAKDYKSWTFWTYATRAEKIFGDRRGPIFRQLRKYREQTRARLQREIVNAHARKAARAAENASSAKSVELT